MLLLGYGVAMRQGENFRRFWATTLQAQNVCWPTPVRVVRSSVNVVACNRSLTMPDYGSSEQRDFVIYFAREHSIRGGILQPAPADL